MPRQQKKNDAVNHVEYIYLTNLLTWYFNQYTMWIDCCNAPLEKVPKAVRAPRLSSVYSPKDLFLSNLPVVPAGRLVTVLRQLFEVACKPDFYAADIFQITTSICVGERGRRKEKVGQ